MSLQATGTAGRLRGGEADPGFHIGGRDPKPVPAMEQSPKPAPPSPDAFGPSSPPQRRPAVSVACQTISFRTCRVDLGGCPPRPPTDPYVRNYRIRFFRSRVRYATVRPHGRSSGWVLDNAPGGG